MNLRLIRSRGSLPARMTSPQKGEVHLWHLTLGELREKTWITLAKTLCPKERIRQNSFLFRQDAQSFATARGFLRHILGLYCAIPPRDITFCYGPWGKPSLGKDAPVSFNLSHSGGHIVIGVCSSANHIGVDVERFKHIEKLESLLAEMHPNEAKHISSLPAALRLKHFFQLWTCKEAVVKASGKGLSIPLGSFEVILTPHPTVIPKETDAPLPPLTLAVPQIAKDAHFAVALLEPSHTIPETA